jgi:ubiquinone/menaquinone biosynthesis C-methylase UbiE
MSHHHTPEKQQQFFEFAYQTGSDIWSHIPYRFVAQAMLPQLPKDSLILDIGAGRGLWAMNLLNMNYRVLGIDYIPSIVDAVNQRIAQDGFHGRGKFIVANALDIPFTDRSFAAITDIGTFQHIQKSDHGQYLKELHRVLEDGGYYLNVSLSKETNRFIGLQPKSNPNPEFHKYGVHYYFFEEEEIKNIFSQHFTIIDQRVEHYDSQSDPGDDLALVFTLVQKKAA